MALPPTPVCRGCKGKFPVSSLGDTQCEVCGELFKLGNLVWGPRFPFELRTRAVRAVRNCYVELLQEADEHYYQRRQVPGPVFGEDKGSLAPAPVPPAPPATPSPAPAPTPRGAEDRAPRPAEEEDKKAEEEEKEVAEKAEAPPAHESERSKEKVKKSPKEKKESRGEKDHPRRHPALGGPRESKRPKQEVAQSSRGPSPKRGERRESLEPAIPVKEEDSSEEVEDEAAVEARLDSPPNVGNRSKEPLPRRGASAGSARPRSPPGPPPRRWEGIIPAGRYQRPPYPDNPIGLAAKSKPKKWKNRGRKKVERQAQRRQERAHRERGWRY